MKKRFLLGLVLSLALILLAAALQAEDFRSLPLSERTARTDKVEYVRGEVLVKFKMGISDYQMLEIHDRLGTEVVSIHRGGVKRLKVPAGTDEQALLSQLSNDPNVEYAELNTICHAFMIPNDPYYTYQWHFPNINMPQAWDVSTGSGVIVGILDSGIAYENYAVPSYELDTVVSGVTQYVLAPELDGTSFVAGYDFINNDSHPNDNDAHGTHVSGTVAQVTNNSTGVAGMAFDCSLMPVKVLDYSGSGTAQSLADGLYWAADNGAQVINMSLGWVPGYNPGPTVANAITYAYNAGVVLLASTGNAGADQVSYPAAYPEVIAVGATRYDDARPSYSQYGSNMEICAPGGDMGVDQNGDTYGDGVLQMTFDGYDPGPPEQLADPTAFGYWFYDGTSMACPHATALVAMMIANGQTGAENIRTILHETALDLGIAGWDQYYGYGRIDAYAALTYGGTPPVAEFSGSPTAGCVPLTVNFTDLSTGETDTWDWTFGDGGTSTAQNPSHQYNNPGNYTVGLTVSGTNGSDAEIKTGYIQVDSAPVGAFYGTPTSGDSPLTVDFFDQSTGNVTSWDWNFGDGGISMAQNPTYEYANDGDYTVSLTVTGPCGLDAEVKTGYIHVAAVQVVRNYAVQDIPVAGTVSGNYTDTHGSDNVYESVLERLNDDRPNKQYSYLEHKWIVNVSGGSSVTFFVEAHQSASPDGDNFVFAYSTDNASYTNLVTVTSTSDMVYSASMPASVSGTVYFRVQDTDRVRRNYDLDEIFIDQMYVECSTTPDAEPPVVTVASPNGGESWQPGSVQAITWNGTDNIGVTSCDIDYTYDAGSNWHDVADLSGNPGSYGWTAPNTPSTQCLVRVTVYDGVGNSDVDQSNGYFTILEVVEAPMYVNSLAMVAGRAGANIYATATPEVVAGTTGIGIEGVVVTGHWSGATSDTDQCTTGPDGKCTVRSDNVKKPTQNFCFTMDTVVRTGNYWDDTHGVKTSCVAPAANEREILAAGVPGDFFVSGAQPNPFNETTQFSLRLPESASVTFSVYNMRGQKVRTLISNDVGAGSYVITWDGTSDNGEPLSSGIYFYRVLAGDRMVTKKLILAR
ncbi:MAG: S8 family serine peptidase [Candidatus Eisenbacteria bacterium]